MSWQQFANLWDQYGPGAAIVVLAIIVLAVVVWGIRTLVKWWPVITQFVSTINIIAKLPERLDRIDRDNKAITDKVEKNHATSADFQQKLDSHLQDARLGTDLLKKVNARLISVESKAGIAADRADVAAEQLRPNGGSTMKDKVDVIPSELAEIKKMLAQLIKVKP